jgi:hypothetical protein
MRRRSYQRALAASAAAVIACLGPTSTALAAPGGHGQGHQGAGSSHGHHGAGNSGANGHHGNGNSGANGNHGNHGNHGHGNGPAEPGNSPGNGGGPGSDGSPPGNNGNVKISGLGDLDGIPNNVAHPGCAFQVEWYGFDEGADIVSAVTFEAQAPTQDVVVAVDGPASVFVGEDPARGGQDLDAVQAYTLSFTGESHPQQGFHVRLTVHTPYSNGNDTKSKVFWVEPCTTTGSSAASSAATSPPGGHRQPGASQLPGHTGPPVAAAAPPAAAVPPAAARPVALDTSDLSDTPAVPTVVDAGAQGRVAGALDLVVAPVPLALIGGGLLLALAAFGVRRRHGAAPVA